ncbi:serine/threonine protein kinase [Roseofilum sp. BLCC_M154]|uniref:Serine/threonine protein kinase n=1 Tax=Roseofilum acuticapitatum BLCC-M154 TaxID=3022444 RepID=A0ABT7AY72_9CYAN|nr:hypothetical protein [Roseofilum acuticapitatum]MDJ1171849.1 serine/threonine protein kinase [Roseofilum acuticapitatum BLCC-M154]
MSLSYLAFGLYIKSDVLIPGLVGFSRAQKADLIVDLDAQPPWWEEFDQHHLPVWSTSSCITETGNPLWIVEELGQLYLQLTYDDGTQFIIDRQGTEVWGTWPEELTLEDTATYLLGPVMGLVLRLRGVTCLHASAIAVGDRAIALVGRSGAGKSTTAAAFAELGYPILSDDIVALVEPDNQILVQPAYPRLRLWPSSAEILYKNPDALPRLVPTNPTWDKSYLDLNQEKYKFQDTPLPLAGIYILGDRTSSSPIPALTQLPKRQALMDLIANTYANVLLDKTMRQQEFHFLSHTVNQVPVYQLNAHPDSEHLFNIPTVILENLSHV